MSQSLNDKAIACLTSIEELNTVFADVNDYGEAAGYCVEKDQIENDAFALFGMLAARAYSLKRRKALADAVAPKEPTP